MVGVDHGVGYSRNGCTDAVSGDFWYRYIEAVEHLGKATRFRKFGNFAERWVRPQHDAGWRIVARHCVACPVTLLLYLNVSWQPTDPQYTILIARSSEQIEMKESLCMLELRYRFYAWQAARKNVSESQRSNCIWIHLVMDVLTPCSC